MTKNTCSNPANMNLSFFAFNLFAALSSSLQAEDVAANILISPYSIASALSLVLAGASDSQCQQELRTVLNVGSHSDIAMLTDNLTQSSVLTSANGIWSKNLKESYVNDVKNTHGAEASDLPTTYAPIDAFITEKTNGLLTNMLEGPVDPLTVAVLVNAVHFKSDWTVQFEKNKTIDGTFTSTDGNTMDAKFMKANRKMSLASNVDLLSGASIVQLDYGEVDELNQTDPEFAAFFILPSEAGKNALADVTQSLVELGTIFGSGVDKSFDKVLQQMSSFRKVDLSLPRFKISYGTKSIKEELKAIGVTVCFNDGTLMNMSDDPQVHLDEVLHKAVVEVTEEGTEAAAATVGTLMLASIPPPPVELTFDRAFIMLIMHLPTMTPVFVARVDDPDLIF